MYSGLYLEKNGYPNLDDERARQALILAIDLHQADLKELAMEIYMIVDIEIRIKVCVHSKDPELKLFPIKNGPIK